MIEQEKSLPSTGDTIRFIRTPVGSWAGVNTPYLVTVEGDTIRLTNLEGGSGTYDKAWSYRDAMWHTEHFAD